MRKIIDDDDAAAIVRSLIVMAHNLGLEVIAEGVETQAQAEFLFGEGCEEAQGFFYGEPLSVDFEKCLRARQRANKIGASFKTRIPERRAGAAHAAILDALILKTDSFCREQLAT